MARRLLSLGAMAYLVRRLSKSRPLPPARRRNSRYLAKKIEAVASTVHEIVSEQVRLTDAEIGERLEARWLRSTDLVLIHGCWNTLADSVPFAERAAPHARRERLQRGLRDAALGFALLLIIFLRIFFPVVFL
jgi:di/tricarboxylate transporter